MPAPKKTKVKVEEVVKEKKENIVEVKVGINPNGREGGVGEFHPDFDISLPENKQRFLR